MLENSFFTIYVAFSEYPNFNLNISGDYRSEHIFIWNKHQKKVATWNKQNFIAEHLYCMSQNLWTLNKTLILPQEQKYGVVVACGATRMLQNTVF